MTNTNKVPFFGGRCCYACDASPVGLRDLRPEGKDLEVACARHADPSIRIFQACIYCTTPVRRGSLCVDGNFAHAACHAEVCS